MQGGASVGVVIPAGGAGSRMARPGAPSKQFRRLGDAPVLVHSVRAFTGWSSAVVVAVPAGEEAFTRGALGDHGVEAEVVAGRSTRQGSVQSGVEALPAGTEVVLVHDAVRPFVATSVIASVIDAARSHGAAAAALPVADTLRLGGAGPLFGGTVSREGLWAMQTPQGARLEWLRRAYGLAAGETFTDEVGLLQHAGFDVRIVEGDARTFKITRPADWSLAEALWPSWSREVLGTGE